MTYTTVMHLSKYMIVLVSDGRTIRWMSVNCESPKEGNWKWHQLLEFLDKEIKIHQRVIYQTKTKKLESSKLHQRKPTSHHLNQSSQDATCVRCGQTDHV